MDMTALEFHPLAEIFPLIEGYEFAGLVDDIRKNGLREPVVLYQGRVLDGRNRLRACEAAGIACRFENYTGDDPVAYVVSLNLRRRHLDESQRAMVAAKLVTLRLGDNQHSEGLPIGRGSELLNVGERTVARARDVIEHGSAELVSAVERGAVSVTAAADIATLSVEAQRDLLARCDDREVVNAASEIRARKAEARRAKRIAKLAEISNANSADAVGAQIPNYSGRPALAPRTPDIQLVPRHRRTLSDPFPRKDLRLARGSARCGNRYAFSLGPGTKARRGVPSYFSLGLRVPNRDGVGETRHRSRELRPAATRASIDCPARRDPDP
jgi:ParB-like chromosome segregation protein Spo0J